MARYVRHSSSMNVQYGHGRGEYSDRKYLFMYRGCFIVAVSHVQPFLAILIFKATKDFALERYFSPPLL